MNGFFSPAKKVPNDTQADERRARWVLFTSGYPVMQCSSLYLVYPSFAPKYALSQNDKLQIKRIMVSRNQVDPSRPIEVFVAALTIPRINATIPRRLAMNAIRACSLGPYPNSRYFAFSGTSAMLNLLLPLFATGYGRRGMAVRLFWLQYSD